MSLGPLMLSLEGETLSDQEREWLLDPRVCGVILFARNCIEPLQIRKLTAEIHEVRRPRLLVAVDQEGGRVQRCQKGFTAIAPMMALGLCYENNADQAMDYARKLAWLMASELIEVGIDFSFAPVLDLNRGISEVIGDRAFHVNPETVIALTSAFCKGFKEAGMAAVGKHFPGHGSVTADSHHLLPVDSRELSSVLSLDARPFKSLVKWGIEAVMPAHVIYPKIDPNHPVCFSEFWIQTVLRHQWGFEGAVISDDLTMAGALVEGSIKERALSAITAGCDMVLLCNDPESTVELLADFSVSADPLRGLRLSRLHLNRDVWNLQTDEMRSIRREVGLEANAALQKMWADFLNSEQ